MRPIHALSALSLLAACGSQSNEKPSSAHAAGAPAFASMATDEWLYECKYTLLNGYQWTYVKKISHAEAGKMDNVCYGYSSLTDFCSEVRISGILGPVVPCNFASTGTKATTWNRL